MAIREDHFLVSWTLLRLGCNPDAHAIIHHPCKCCFVYDDKHPHFVLEPLFLALTHRSLELFRLLLHCYRQVPFRSIRLLTAVLNSSHELRTHFNDDMKHKLHAWLDDFWQAKTLKDLCRHVLRACVRSPLHMWVKELPIGEKLKDFICMDDLFQGVR